MTDPVSDPAPRWSTKTVLGFAGWVAALAMAYSGLRSGDATLATAISNGQIQQSLIDKGQAARLDKIEAKQAQMDALLFDIRAAVLCRGKAKRMGDEQE